LGRQELEADVEGSSRIDPGEFTGGKVGAG